jgi:hypothetical protein
MDKVALLSAASRADLFRETASRKAMSPAVVEKDFWVCFVLARLFADEFVSRKILFKGGTSLAKVFKLIERFSEDIDLILDWREISQVDPRASRSRTKQDALNKQLQLDGQAYIREQFLPRIMAMLPEMKEIRIDNDPNVVTISYPTSFSESYIRPEIRLEIGPLAIWIPNADYEICSYAAEEFPALFEKSQCLVRAIRAERTFWEKVTILHHEAHRPETSMQPLRYSRHYYDLARMANSEIKKTALADLALLKSVVESKEQFYPRNWARYDLAKPGTIRLMPPEHLIQTLRKDYKEMQVMIYGKRDSFDIILDQIQTLENEINALATKTKSQST